MLKLKVSNCTKLELKKKYNEQLQDEPIKNTSTKIRNAELNVIVMSRVVLEKIGFYNYS
jgi:hypothetical protein